MGVHIETLRPGDGMRIIFFTVTVLMLSHNILLNASFNWRFSHFRHEFSGSRGACYGPLRW